MPDRTPAGPRPARNCLSPPPTLTTTQQMGWYSIASMAPNGHVVVRLEFTSGFEMVDFVQIVADHVGRGVGLDDEGVHWMGVAVRECVINAIKHGNLGDAATGTQHEPRNMAETGITFGAADGAQLQLGGGVQEGETRSDTVWTGKMQLNIPLK